MLAFVLGLERTDLYKWQEQETTVLQQQAFLELATRRREGVPIAYLTGTKEFWSLSLKVNEAVLIPRPETELLIEEALKKIKNKTDVRIIDLGTGSGAIALALASECPLAQIRAADISAEALAVAIENAERLGLQNVAFYQSDWLSHPRLQDFQPHLILSNPPYIEPSDPHLAGDIRYEPLHALVSLPEGLSDLRCIIKDAFSVLMPEGWLLVEHGFNQSEAVQALFKEQNFIQIKAFPDLAGIPRIVLGQKP